MTQPARPQIYLLSPPDPLAPGAGEALAAALDAAPVACLRLRSARLDEASVARAADLLRPMAHDRDIPLVIETHIGLVAAYGLDGVHLVQGARGVRRAREALGEDAIIGASCGASRHEGLSAGEAGADYVVFEPAGETQLGTGERAEAELFAWWSEMIELPVVAEGALDPALIAALAQAADFFAIGDEIWAQENPAAALAALDRAIG